MNNKKIKVGIDATNIRAGGGITHLMELLDALNPVYIDIDAIIVWGGSSTLNQLKNQSWLLKKNPSMLEGGILSRTYWQFFHLSNAARSDECDVLFVTGGSYAGNFHPVVTMSQNLLPFDFVEIWRYFGKLKFYKLLLLRITQYLSFKRSEGVIFLTEYARKVIINSTDDFYGNTCIIPHGVNIRFDCPPKFQRDISSYSNSNPYRFLYVSIIDLYKHQWNVVEAVSLLRGRGIPIALDLVGPSYPPALLKLNSIMNRVDPYRHWVCYHGPVAFDGLHTIYKNADAGIFSSSCENMPNILIEKMISGLPIACSNRGPMPEVLGSSGVYFDPEDPIDIANVLLELVNSSAMRTSLSGDSYKRAKKYSWEHCAVDTFGFLNEISRKYIAKS